MGCQIQNLSEAKTREVFPDPSVAALATAACEGNAETVRNIVQQGVDLNSAGREGVTPLAWVIQCQEVEGVKELLKAGADPNYKIRGTNMVWIAAGFPKQEIVQVLVEAGGDIHNTSPSGHTVLMHALESGSWETYDYLLRIGVNINQCEEGGLRSSIADLAISAGELERLEELLNRGYRCDLLGIAYGLEHFNWHPDYIEKRDRVQNLLRDLGVKWPLPETLRNEDRIAYMTTNPEYAKQHPESSVSIP